MRKSILRITSALQMRKLFIVLAVLTMGVYCSSCSSDEEEKFSELNDNRNDDSNSDPIAEIGEKQYFCHCKLWRFRMEYDHLIKIG